MIATARRVLRLGGTMYRLWDEHANILEPVFSSKPETLNLELSKLSVSVSWPMLVDLWRSEF